MADAEREQSVRPVAERVRDSRRGRARLIRLDEDDVGRVERA